MAFKFPRLRIVVFVVAAWALYGVFFACQAYISLNYLGREVSFSQVLLVWLSCALIWILFTPLVYKLAQNLPFERGRLPRTIFAHLGAASLISLATLGLFTFFSLLINGRAVSDFTFLAWQNLIVADFHFNVLLYFALIGLYNCYSYYWRFREHQQRAMQLEIEAAQLETQLAQAQLNALKMQIHPHFLFNTLNSISVLMPDDPKAANQMLVRLSELLRVALKSEATQVIPLRQELDFLRDYLAIEQTRFQDRLTVDFKIADETLDATVPNLILQPLVENAIRHGIAPRAEAGHVQIRASRNNGFMELSVIDDGAGMVNEKKSGIGLKNTRARLEKLYGRNQSFNVGTGDTGGVRVDIRIPFSTNEQPDPSFDRR